MAQQLHQVAEAVRAGKCAEALARLNELATNETRPRFRGRIAALVADVQMRQGRFDEAANAFGIAVPLQAGHSREWIRPRLGVVRARLKAVRVSEADTQAEALWQEVMQRQRAWDKAVITAKADIAVGRVATLPPMPWRPSVVASRLARLFVQEGEPQLARVYLERALSINPLGACRARLGLAELALREGNPAEAKMRAREALVLGRFKAKTVFAWKLLLAAQAKLGENTIEADLQAGLDQARPSVRARSTLEIVKALRSQRNPAWKAHADEWLTSADAAQFPEIVADLRKMQMAEQRALKQDVPAAQAAAAALLATPGLTAMEWLAGAKEQVRTSALSGAAVLHDALLLEAGQTFGQEFVPRARHSLALAAHEGRRSDIARLLLELNLGQLNPAHVQWRISLWALARLEWLTHRPTASATRWLQFASQTDIPGRFRGQALRRGVDALRACGDAAGIAAAVTQLEALVAAMTDWIELMDVLRQINHLQAEAGPWVGFQKQRAETLAREAFAAATHPTQALQILLVAFRRLALDLGRARNVFRWWESLTATQRDSLWTEAEPFWELLSVVHAAATRCGEHVAADTLVDKYLEDSATPAAGTVWLGMARATWQWDQGNPKKALEFARWVVLEHGQHNQCAPAHYWLALAAHQRGDASGRVTSTQACLRALGRQVGLTWQWELLGRAHVLLAELDPAVVSPGVVRYEPATLVRLAEAVRRDLEKTK